MLCLIQYPGERVFELLILCETNFLVLKFRIRIE